MKIYKWMLLLFVLSLVGSIEAQVVNTQSNDVDTRTELRLVNAGSTALGLRIGINPSNANGNVGFIRLTENRPLVFYTNNQEQLRIRENGSVGIGTTTTSELLDVNGNGRFRGITTGTNSFLTTHENNGTLHQIPFTGNSTDVLLGDGTFGAMTGGGTSDADWYDAANLNNPPTNINNSIYTFGNVGIGKDAPTVPLNVDLPTGGEIVKFSVSNRDALDDAFIFNGGINGSPTLLTVRGRIGPGRVLVRRDNGQGVQLNSQMAGSNGVGIEPVSTNTLYIGGTRIIPNNDAVQLGQSGRAFDYFGADRSFVIDQEINPSAGFFIKLGNSRDDASATNTNKRGLVIRAPSTLAPTTGDGTEYNNTHYFQVCNNVGGNLPGSRTLFTISPFGHVGIALGGTETTPTTPNCALEVNGDVCLPAGNAYIGSDAKYKKNITPLKNTLDKVLRLSGNSYEMRQSEFPNLAFKEGTKIGLIAQEVEAEYPELIKTNDKGYKAINYDGLIPVLVEAIKEQQAVINRQNERIEDLENGRVANAEIENLREEMEALKILIAQTNNGLTESTIEIWLDGEGQSIFLGQNQPNPFQEFTNISYFIPDDISNARIEIYKLNGQLLKKENLEPGKGMIKVYASNLTSGAYTYSIIADEQIVVSKRMVLAE